MNDTDSLIILPTVFLLLALQVRKIAVTYDVNDDEEISLEEFNAIINKLAPGKYTDRKIRKMFLHLYELYITPGQKEGEDDEDMLEKAVAIPEVAAFCLSSGIFAPPEFKQTAALVCRKSRQTWEFEYICDISERIDYKSKVYALTLLTLKK